MKEKKALDVVKNAILLEHKGKVLYESVVQTSKNEKVKGLFLLLAKEEEKHIDILNQHFKKTLKGEAFEVQELERENSSVSEKILSIDIVDTVFGAGYESAVISAALEFEKNAVKFYSEQASAASSDKEEKLYKWLADFEKEHMHMLARLDNEIKEQIWHDNRFWPMD